MATLPFGSGGPNPQDSQLFGRYPDVSGSTKSSRCHPQSLVVYIDVVMSKDQVTLVFD